MKIKTNLNYVPIVNLILLTITNHYISVKEMSLF